MPYLRTKNIKGKEYLYLVEGKRVNGVVRQKVLRYLGPANPIYRIN